LKLNLIEKLLGSGFYTGYVPFASGTFGSLAAVLIYLIPGFENPTVLLLSISIFTVIGVNLGTKFEKIYGRDPKECTIDEFVGTWISLLFLPKNVLFISGAFIIWRLFDIIKPFPANSVEKIKGGWGIVLDDVISGFYSFIVIQIILYFVY
jgi:phosphatidylglycerophosphatase A